MMLDQIIGNLGPRASLAAALQEGRLPHSVLLLGEEGCGVGFAARCLAADFLYPQGGPQAQALVQGLTSQAVTEKDGGGRILTGQVREAVSVRGDGAGGEIRVGAVRALRAEMFNTSLSGEGRAAIFYGAQSMNQNSANALLKILEEPPANTLFILTANSAAAVLPTIRSRCAQYTFSPVSPADCQAYLQRSCPTCQDPAFLSVVFGGCIGKALKAAGDPAQAALLADARAMAAAAAQKQEYPLLVLLAGYEKDRLSAMALLDLFVTLCDAALLTPGLEGLTLPLAAAAIRQAQAARKALSGYVNTRLVLTNLAIRLAE